MPSSRRYESRTDISFCLIQRFPNDLGYVKFPHKIPFTNVLIHCPLPLSKTGGITLRIVGIGLRKDSCGAHVPLCFMSGQTG